MSDYIIEKTYSDNPFVDDLLYYIKQLAFGCVIKNEQSAEADESLESAKQADFLIMCTEGNIRYELFNYTVEQLVEAGVKESLAISIVNGTTNPNTGKAYTYDDVPYELKEPLRQIGIRDFLANYVELNDYYRMLCGLPNIGDYGIPIRDYEYLMPEGNIWDATYIHEIGTSGAILLDDYGILDQIKADYPDADYLDYITCGITPYTARKAYEFQILYTPTIDNEVILDQFTRIYENNRVYVTSTFYSEAFKYNSDYYDNFITLLIILLTMTEMLSKVQENIIRKDLLDQRCIEYLFDQYGMPYYTSIPIKYQERICKNLNTLIRSKSCTQGMFDIINLFGAENLSVFKYFILRDRNLDQWGNFLYNEIITKTSEENNVIDHTREEVDGITELTIPFPFEHYLEKGNVMIVWKKNADGTYTRLEEGTDYSVNNYDTLVPNTGVLDGATGIRYDFYYDIRTMGDEEVPLDNSNAVITSVEYISARKNIISYNLPYKTYLTDGNELIVFVGGEPLLKDMYTVNQGSATITLDPGFFPDDKSLYRDIFILYVYHKDSVTKFKRTDLVATQQGQKDFTVPEPFFNYCARGNTFFVTFGNTFIANNRYTIHDDNHITFDESVDIDLGRKISFNFIYSLDAVYAEVELKTHVETITVTEKGQTEFDIHPPFDGYMKTGYKIYAKLNGKYLEQNWYSTFYHTLSFNTKSIGANLDDTVEVVYVYGPYGESSRNVKCKNFHTAASEDGQTTFTGIQFPDENYFDRKGQVIVDVYGEYLTSDQYTLNDETGVLVITDELATPSAGQAVNILFVYQDSSEEAVHMTQNIISIEEDGQEEFDLTLPFYPYFETGQGCLVFYQTLLIPPSDIEVNDTKVTIKNQEFKAGHELVFLYIYNNWYLTETQNRITVEDRVVHVLDSVNDDLQIELNPPFVDYFEHNWPYFVSDNKTLVDESTYELFNNGIGFVDAKEILEHDDLTFTYIYINNSDFIHEVYEEDVDQDFTLRFVGVPLEDEYFLNNIILKQNVVPYDTTTMDDVFWDGVGGNADIMSSHEYVKRQILQKKFNYERTKYYGLNYVINIADMSFQISYFYSMLWDDVFTEKYLNVRVPAISSAKSFNLGHLFCYLTALAYLYEGITDSIMDTPSKIMYVKGFNMKANLQDIMDAIYNERQTNDMYPIWDFIIPEHQIQTMEEFLNVYNTNKEVYTTVVHGMYQATKYRYYKIWKLIYDSLMTWQFNLRYFTLDSTGQIASTFTEFLQEKDQVLYNNIIKVQAIQDDSSMKEYIANHIADVVYILEEYLGGYEFHHIFDRFPGVSETALMDYIYTIVNFFKSFKIQFRSKGDYITFSSDDPNINSIRPHDDAYLNIHLNKPDYIYLEEIPSANVHMSKKDSHNIYDRITVIDSTEGQEGLAINIFITKYDHQTIYVHTLGKIYTDDVVVPYNTEFNCTIEAEYGYSAGKLNIVHGIATHDVTITATEVEPQMVTITIIQSDHQKITVNAAETSTSTDSTDYTTSFQCPMGTYLRASIVADYGYTPGKLSFNQGSAMSDMTIYADDATIHYVTYHINEVGAHQNLLLKIYNIENGGYTTHDVSGGDSGVMNYMEPTSVQFGTKYEATITADPGYDTGSFRNGLPLIGILEAEDTEFSVGAESLTIYTITITQSAQQVITVRLGDQSYTESTTSTYGVTYVVTSTADIGYKPGYIHIDLPDGGIGAPQGTVASDMNIYADPVSKADDVYITILQTNHQTITVECQGVKHTSSFYAPYGAPFTSTVEADEHYIAGVVNMPTGVADQPLTVYASPATGELCMVTIIQSDHQTIIVTINQADEYQTTFDGHYGDSFTVEVIPDVGWDAGTPNVSFGTLDGDTTISATPATPGELTITLNQSPNQTIYASINGGEKRNDWQQIAIYGDTYQITIEGNPGYKPGTLSVVDEEGNTQPAYGSMTTNLIASASTQATEEHYTITILQSDPEHQLVTVYIDGTPYTETVSGIGYGLSYTITVNPIVEGYNGGSPIGVAASGVIEGDMTIDASPAEIQRFTITINQTANQTIHANVGGTDYTSTVSNIAWNTPYTLSVVSNNPPQWAVGSLVITDANSGDDQTALPASGNVKTDITVTATAVTLRTYTITIIQSANQLITVHIN